MSDTTELPKPTFIDVDNEDGAVHLTWCFGEQGHPDSWRVMYLWQPGEGVNAALISSKNPGIESVDGDAVGPALARWLGPMVTGSEEKG